MVRQPDSGRHNPPADRPVGDRLDIPIHGVKPNRILSDQKLKKEIVQIN